MCECIKKLSELHYVQPNLLGKNYFIVASEAGKVIKKSPYFEVGYCPNCGAKLNSKED
jgi:hypothetical protein